MEITNYFGMKMYGDNSVSIPQKTTLLLLETLIIIVSWLLLFGNGFEKLGVMKEPGDIWRRGLVFGFNLVVFIRMLITIFYLLKRKEIPKITKAQFGMLFLFLVPIFYYQAYIIFTYHSLVPTFNMTHPEEYLKSAFFVPETFRHYLTHYEWFDRMRHYIEGGWFGIHSHHSFTKETVWQYMGLLILHVLALFALFFRCKTENRSFCLVGKIALLSLLSVLVVQYFQSYGVHLSKGYIGGLQPRYLLPFMFAFAIMASMFVERFNKLFIVTILTIVICIHAIYSDFFYFLQYYQ